MRRSVPRWLLVLLPLAACVGVEASRGVARAPSVAKVAPSASAVSPIASADPAGAASASTTAPDDESSAPIAQVAPDEGVAIAPGPAGHLGAWLALGPFLVDDTKKLPSTKAWRPPARDEKGKVDPARPPLDDHAFAPKLGDAVPTRIDHALRSLGKDGKPQGKPNGWTTRPATWTLASSGDGPIDLEKTLTSSGKPAVGYLGGVLRLPVATKLLLLVGSDDGCEVIVDGKSVFERDASRPQRDDDDLIPLDLPAGDHPILFKLHQRDAGWAIRVRLVDRAFRPPLGVRLMLPGVDAKAAAELASTMSWVRLVREPSAAGWSFRTLVRFPEGAPVGPELAVKGSVLEGATPILAHRDLGAVSIGPRATGELEATIGDQPDDFDVQARALTVRVEVAGRVVEGASSPRRPVRQAIVAARALLASFRETGRPAGLPEDVEATIAHLEERLSQQVARGDLDLKSQLADAKELAAFAADAAEGVDPIAKRTGPMRLAHFARADGKPQPIAVYVPKDPGAAKKRPLYVGLHGMNGGPMAMLRIFFGGDDQGQTMAQLDRGMGPVAPLDAFVIAPHAHGNAMYRQLGEQEVLDAIAWARARWPSIDPDRVYVTGFSLGGIGAASIPLHHPHVFAAAQPLCGYHSYFVRRDVAGRPRRPWEQYLLEDRSNTSWVDKGARLPMWIVHGTKDLPEHNSGVLIEAYEKRKFPLVHDHPDLGHDVWGWAYDARKHVEWFSQKKRVAHPKHVRFRTARPRFGDDAWVHVERMSGVAEWGTIDAKVESKSKIVVQTQGIGAFRLDRDPALVDGGPVEIVVDGQKLSFAAGAALVAHRADGAGATWTAGPPSSAGDDGPRKEGRITGPIRDVWFDPLTIVYGADDPAQTQANLEVARALATIRWGVDVRYPIVKDSEVDPDAATTTATILVGNARSNRIVRALEAELPVRVDVTNGSIVFGGKTFTGPELGAAFVVPHPRAKDQYLLVVEGVDALGTFRALSLPDLLPDFVIWDARLAPARGQVLLGFGEVLAAGYFDTRWRPPASFDDPFAAKVPVAAKNEKDATPYLP